MELSTLSTLVRIYLQTLALSVLFVVFGKQLFRKVLPGAFHRPYPVSFLCGGAFFFGLAVFLALFVLFSRLTASASVALWLSLAVMGAAALAELRFLKEPNHSFGDWLLVSSSLLLLVVLFTVTNATCWLEMNSTGPSLPPKLLTHFGSIHSGRFANYVTYIAEHDRIPFLAQNLGQCLLASCQLMWGIKAPLAALMVWIPFSLAFLACLVFGLFRLHGLSTGWCFSGTYFVLYCNITLSLVHALVFDGGSPLAFMGSTDVIVGIGTFLLATVWLRAVFQDPQLVPRWKLFFPFIVGTCWAWAAPQNVVIAAATALGMTIAHWITHRTEQITLLGRSGAIAAAFLGGVVLGSTQFGAFLPQSMQEDIGAPVFTVRPEIRVRPYVSYVITHWSDRRPNATVFPGVGPDKNVDAYQYNYRQVHAQGRAAVFNRWVTLFETHLCAIFQVYGFPILGLLLMQWKLRRWTGADAGVYFEPLRTWFWIALFSLLSGLVIVFMFELSHLKWWLTRFLVPGATVCLIGLVLALNGPATRGSSLRRRLAWELLLVAATFGPWLELLQTFRAEWIEGAKVDSIAHRLNVLASATGPFVE